MGDGPVRLRAAEAVLVGAAMDAACVRAAGVAAREACAPSDDLHASGAYRRHLAGVLTAQAVSDAIGRLERQA